MIIDSELQLRKYLPNAFATVEGEVSLYDKLKPYLAEAEVWLKSSITGKDMLLLLAAADDTDTAKGEAARAVTCDALMHAIPSLDVVLTPNGFGVVSNQNVAPASKDRVQRLMNSMEQQRDDAVTHLLKLIRGQKAWQQSPVFNLWCRTLFPDIGVVSQLGVLEHQFAKYLELIPSIIHIETMMAEEFISRELLEHLHRYQFGIGYDRMTPKEQSGRAYVITHLRAEIVSQLQGNPMNRNYMTDLVQFIRQEPEMFPQWHASATAQLFSPTLFKNKKEAQGYFF